MMRVTVRDTKRGTIRDTVRISVLCLLQVYAGYLEHTDTQDGKVIEDC